MYVYRNFVICIQLCQMSALSKLQDPRHCIIDLSLRNKGQYFTSEKMKKGDVRMAKHFSGNKG